MSGGGNVHFLMRGEAIWGEPLCRASAAGAQTPRLEVVYALLKNVDLVRRRAVRGRVTDELSRLSKLDCFKQSSF